MKTFQWTAQTTVTVAIALLLAASVGIMGGWLLLSGQPGTGMMESSDHPSMMSGVDMSSSDHATMMGAPANRGLFGGYTGTIGLIMILAFVGMVGLLLYALFREKPGQPQPATCRNCERPVDTDWITCPYCGAALVAQATLP